MTEKSVGQQIDDIIQLHGGWKAAILSQLRTVITDTDDRIFEEVKWRMRSRPEGLAVWSYKGIVCFAEIFKNDIKLVFFYGAFLKDTNKSFNARLKSSSTRAIEYHEDSTVDASAIQVLVRGAISYNEHKKA